LKIFSRVVKMARRRALKRLKTRLNTTIKLIMIS